MKFDKTLMNIVKKNVQLGIIPMLLGEPGIGKSSWVIDLGKELHTKVFVLACNQLADKADLTGTRLVPVKRTIKNANGKTSEITDYEQHFYPHVVICEAINYALENPNETPILFLDELNRTTPDVTSEALSIPTLRSIGNRPLPDNLRVITAGNDKGNITSLDEASISRFALYHVVPDTLTFLKLDDSLNVFIKNVLTKHPETIFMKNLPAALVGANNNDDDDNEENIADIFDEGEDMYQITTPRTISALSKMLNSFTNDEIKAMLMETSTNDDGDSISVLQEVLEGHTGHTPFTLSLLQEINTNINTINVQSNVFTVPKPTCFDSLKTQPTIDAINDFVSNMTDNDKAGCLVYAMFENTDNTDIVVPLASELTVLPQNDMQNLIKMFSTNMIADVNKNAFFSVNNKLTTGYQNLFT